MCYLLKIQMRDEENNPSLPSTSTISSSSDDSMTSSKSFDTRADASKKHVKCSLPQPSTSNGKPVQYARRDFGYNSSLPFAPWRRKRYTLTIAGLHDEIVDMYHWIKPNEIESRLRNQVFEKVQESVMKRWKDKNVKISMFGSLRTNLFLPSSDIDVLVECADWDGASSEVRDFWLQETAEGLTYDKIAENVSVFSGAYVPIVKMVDRDTQLSIDISFNTVQGVRAADYIEKVKREFPLIEPLVLLIKQFLHYRNLNQTFTGGLSSYGLILMLVNFFQMYAPDTRYKKIEDNSVNLGKLLLRFFEIYSIEFNYEEIGICVSQLKYMAKTAPGCRYGIKRSQPGNLALADPLLEVNDVGRSTYNFSSVANAFGQALQILMVAVTVRDRKRSPEWMKAYKGSLLHLIMPFTAKELMFRNWLMGSLLSYPEKDTNYDLNVICNTLLSPPLDLSKFNWLRSQPSRSEKVSRPLKIETPDDLKKVEKKEEVVKKIEEKKKELEEEEVVESARIEDHEELRGPPLPISTASVATTMSTTTSSERDDVDTPPLSSRVTSSDDEEKTKQPFYMKSFVDAVTGTSKKRGTQTVQTDFQVVRPNYTTQHLEEYLGYPPVGHNSYASSQSGERRSQGYWSRERKPSRNHSQGSDGSSYSNEGPARKWSEGNSRAWSDYQSNPRRGRSVIRSSGDRGSSNSSNRSQRSSKAASLSGDGFELTSGRYSKPSSLNGMIEMKDMSENGNGDCKIVSLNTSINGTHTPIRYADAVKNNSQQKVKQHTTVAEVSTTTSQNQQNGNMSVQDTSTSPERPAPVSYRNVATSQAKPIIDASKTMLNSPMINEMSQPVLVNGNRKHR